jgi:transcriptional regulator with XRE-family HTH domain
MATFGERLKAARERAGLSQAGLAEASGVPVGNIRDYEQARREPLVGKAAKLARALGISLDLLAVEEAVPPEPQPRGRPRKAEAPGTDGASPKGKAASRRRTK